MVADRWPIGDTDEVAALGVRRGFRGKLVLQVRHQRYEFKPEEFGGNRHLGMGPWRDANGDDPHQVAQIVKLLTPNAALCGPSRGQTNEP